MSEQNQPEKESQVVSKGVRIPTSLHEAIEDYRWNNRMTFADFFRAAAWAYLNRNTEKTRPTM